MKLVRPILLAFAAAILVAAFADAAPRAVPPPKPRKPVPEFVRGEVIELSCYMQDSKSRGEEHAACAQEGILAGGPVGILTSDGKLYLVLGKTSRPPNDVFAPLAGRKVKVTGKKLTRARMLAIIYEKVEELPPPEKPKPKPARRK